MSLVTLQIFCQRANRICKQIHCPHYLVTRRLNNNTKRKKCTLVRCNYNYSYRRQTLSQNLRTLSSTVPWIDKLEISKYKRDKERADRILATFIPEIKETSTNFLGFQHNQNIPLLHPLLYSMEFHMNNVGDPFFESYYKTHCKSFERAVIDYFAGLWRNGTRIDDKPNDPNNYWGYVLNMGSTEGNLNALWNARDKMQELSPDKTPIVLFSTDTHYSIKKACDILRMQSKSICTDKCGRININELAEIAEIYASKPSQRPIITVYNMGTTFKGAYDDCKGGIARINAITKKYCVPYWNHLDGALGGCSIPYLRRGVLYDKIIQIETDEYIPDFGFHIDIQSVCASFYKWFGAPYPTGIYMTKNKFLRLRYISIC